MGTTTMRCAILDDYQNVALTMADWAPLADRVDITVFNEGLGDEAAVAAALAEFEIICLMRERTPFPASLIRALPKLKLIVTSGPRNAAIDVAAAKGQGVIVCGTESVPHPTAELTFAHILEFARRVGAENVRLKSGAPWQETIGLDLNGRTLGLLGLGRLGGRVAKIAQAFEMKVIAWSENLTDDRAAEQGVLRVTKEQLFRESDFLSIHLVLSQRSMALVGAAELALMKPSAVLVNTSRGPIVDEAALLESTRSQQIAGACLDVFDNEPLALDHLFRSDPRIQLSPHLGYVTEQAYQIFYTQTVENIIAFLNGNPSRVIE